MALHEVSFTGCVIVNVDDDTDLTDTELCAKVDDLIAYATVKLEPVDPAIQGIKVDEWCTTGAVRRNIKIVGAQP